MIPDIKLHLLRGVWNCSTVTVDFLFWCSTGVAGETKGPGHSPRLRHLILQRVMTDNPTPWLLVTCLVRLDGNRLKRPKVTLSTSPSEHKHCKGNAFKCGQKEAAVTQ